MPEIIAPRLDASAVTLRPEEPTDESFLLELYASTREEELAMTGWDERTREEFVQMQFHAQRVGYRSAFPRAQFAIVIENGAPAGRLVVNRTPEELRVVDIVVARTHRNRGIGTELMRRLIQEAASANKPLRLQVLKGSRAARLYERLGFTQVGASACHDELQWSMTRPARSAVPSSVRLPLAFDAVRLWADLDGILANEFVPHFNARYYEGDWSAVPLRSVGGRTDQIYPDPTAAKQFIDTPLLGRCPYVRDLLASFPTELQSVRFLRLKAGSMIKEHCDYNLSLEDGELRLHIPVTTNPEVEFILNRQRLVMNPGELWYCNFNLPHSVANRGATDRIHLVIDCFVNEWLRELIMKAAVRPPATV